MQHASPCFSMLMQPKVEVKVMVVQTLFFIDRRGAQAQDLFILHGIKHVHCQTLQQCIGNMTTSECTTGWGAAE